MKEQLNRIEQRLQYLIETSLPALIPLGSIRRTLVHEVIDAMQANLFTAADGSTFAPNVYTLVVNPERLPDWQSEPEILSTAARSLYQSASEAGVRFIGTPQFRLAQDASIPNQEVRIVASISRDEVSDTAAIPAQAPEAEVSDAIPSNAFLIVNGVQVFPLHQAVINIGRRLDNQLVIDDPRVSRTHAQLRVIRGKYILFDLNSTGGSYVNGQRVSRYNLNPGDVISLAGVALIFGQDALPPQNDDELDRNTRDLRGSTENLPKLSSDLPPDPKHV
jgi:pSer/pThr/pTyr-binding forkhead associated (FHA) protein